MARNPQADYGFLRHAITVSLVLHAMLLLQPGVTTPSTTAMKPLIASLRSTPPIATPPALGRAASPPSVSTRTSGADAASIPGLATAHVATRDSAFTLEDKRASRSISDTALDGAADFAEGKKSYLFAIAAEARRLKGASAQVIAEGNAGTVQIRVEVAPGGTAQAPQLFASSGNTDLDAIALSLVGTAMLHAPVPDQLRGQGFAVVLPVTFGEVYSEGFNSSARNR